MAIFVPGVPLLDDPLAIATEPLTTVPLESTVITPDPVPETAFNLLTFALVQLVPSETIAFPLVPGAAKVAVDATQFVPSEIITFLLVALAFGNVGVDQLGAALEPLTKTLFAVEVEASP